MNEVTKIEPQETAPAIAADPVVSMIERVALDQNADIEKLERMMAMKERMDAKNAEQDFNAAFARAAAAFPDIPLNGKGHQDKPYATLRDIISHTRPALSENGLALSFDTKAEGPAVTVTAILMHQGGHSRTTSIELPRDTSGSKNAVQAVGSSQTYGQRYAAQAVLGLSLGEDTEDDGRNSGRPVQPDTPRPRTASWADTILQELPPNATDRDKGEALATAICAQWKRMKGVQQLDNEWDRRAGIIGKLETNDPDLWGNVIQGYEERRHELDEKAADKETLKV